MIIKSLECSARDSVERGVNFYPSELALSDALLLGTGLVPSFNMA